MSSRFLNLLVRNLNPRCLPYNVHRLNPANLFYPTISPEPKTFEDSPKIEDVLLPPARLNFAWPCLRRDDFGFMDFMAFGRSSRDNILSVDQYGSTFLYKFISRTFHNVMPVPPKRVMDPITFAVGDDLCAFDLTALIKHGPPVTQNLGKDLVAPPENCTLRKTKLLPLGAGRLGIAKFFRTEPPLELRCDELYAYTPEYFVVLTGVEVLDDCNGNGLHMIRHKSNRYSFGKNLVDPL